MVTSQYKYLEQSGELASILNGVFALSNEPSALTNNAEEIVSCNAAWPRESERKDSEPQTLRSSLEGFEGVGELIDSIRAGFRGGSDAASGVSGLVSGTKPAQHFDAHWRHFASTPNDHRYTAIVLRPKRSEDASSVRYGAERLIVRQALIEEAERLRLGRALHDTVVQDLAWLRSDFLSKAKSDFDHGDCVSTIDRIIERVRTLSFELSPPVLADLGLLAALEWLGEHIGDRYDQDITVIDDEKEPPLSPTMRTIVFRCVRELAINAAKHAPGSEIIISCRTTPTEVIVQVRDYGPGFDTSRIRMPDDDQAGFGLISVEQQIRGIGGKFELVSELGSGTRATIRIPLPSRKGDGDD